MIESGIYCYVNDFLKWNICKKTSLESKEFTGKTCIPNLRNNWKSIFARVIIRYYGWKKITKEMGKIIIKNTYRWNNRTKFSKCITRGKHVHFRSTIDTSRRPEGYNLSYSFLLKIFFVTTYVKNFVVKLHVSRLSLIELLEFRSVLNYFYNSLIIKLLI